MRVRLEDPRLLHDLCAYLEADGCLTARRWRCEAEVAIPGVASEHELAETLAMEIRLWLAEHESTDVTLIGG